jgi:CHAT domain-containing protein
MKTNLHADLAVLSACETGLGQQFRGEGILGLSWAFLAAGASSVVVSQWDVNDASTKQLMVDFYQNLKHGDSKAVALQHAQVSLIRDGVHRDPYYWAPLCADRTVRVSVGSRAASGAGE